MLHARPPCARASVCAVAGAARAGRWPHPPSDMIKYGASEMVIVERRQRLDTQCDIGHRRISTVRARLHPEGKVRRAISHTLSRVTSGRRTAYLLAGRVSNVEMVTPRVIPNQLGLVRPLSLAKSVCNS